LKFDGEKLVSTIDAETLRSWLEEGKPVVVLDVRSAADRATWSIPGSLHIDAYADLRAHKAHALDSASLPTNVPVVTVCNVGHVSQIASKQLKARGIEASSLEGGMRAWSLSWNTADISLSNSNAEVIQVRRVGKGCLSYLIGSQGEAAVIDAALQPEVYLDLAKKRGWSITAVLDTHIHADHLSRSRLLAEQSGARVYFPDQKRVVYPFMPLRNGSIIKVGEASLMAIPTRGHTVESMSYLLDRQALFTGDTLFLDGVGRPDLHATKDETRLHAQLLHHSLHHHLLMLPARTLVLPGHTNTPTPFDKIPLTATLGDLRNKVELLRLSESEFVDALVARIPPVPPNHARVIELNEAGELIENPIELEAGANNCGIS
jgi:glyoxylase-like metal-dependent hydrolase (beta-lactamase superfamily II)/rhodanese-related sulfurtransferase